jgi:CubicO group peptidase (beta-lactamase class C family)
VSRFFLIKTMILLGLVSADTVHALEGASEQIIRRLDGSIITSSQVDAAVQRLMREKAVTGVGLAILNDGQIAYLKLYGFRDKGKNLSLTPDSVTTAASLSKVVPP